MRKKCTSMTFKCVLDHRTGFFSASSMCKLERKNSFSRHITWNSLNFNFNHSFAMCRERHIPTVSLCKRLSLLTFVFYLPRNLCSKQSSEAMNLQPSSLRSCGFNVTYSPYAVFVTLDRPLSYHQVVILVIFTWFRSPAHTIETRFTIQRLSTEIGQRLKCWHWECIYVWLDDFLQVTILM